jgi:arginyl-tRNA synthetase
METMRALEVGEFRPLIERILNAQLQTAFRLGIFYHLLNWESDLVSSHTFQQAMDALKHSPRVYRPESGRYAGALVIQTGEPGSNGEEAKAEVLIRSNSIPTYVGKDIAYHLWKFGLLPDRIRYVEYMEQPNGEMLYSTALHGESRVEPTPQAVINVIAVNQSLAQEAVKEALRAAGYPREAEDLFHLGYGLVSTKEGKLSGRKGTAASGDWVIDEAVRVALDRVQERDEGLDEVAVQKIAEAVGVGAVRYFMTQYNPLRDIVFDVADVVSYDGNTALYIQYALVRMFAILRKAKEEHGIDPVRIECGHTALLQHEQEKRLVYHMSLLPQTIADVARTLSVNLLAEFAFELATIFSQFYRDCSVLGAEPELRLARLLLVTRVRDVLANSCGLLGIPLIERL